MSDVISSGGVVLGNAFGTRLAEEPLLAPALADAARLLLGDQLQLVELRAQLAEAVQALEAMPAGVIEATYRAMRAQAGQHMVAVLPHRLSDDQAREGFPVSGSRGIDPN